MLRASTIICGATAFLLAVSCVDKKRADPDYLVIALEAAPRQLDPRLGADAVSSKIGDLLFNGLVKRDVNMKIAPDLAISWETPTPTQYKLKLRENVFFHDGAPFTSADVAATYNFILDPKNASPFKGAFKVIKSIETPDDATVIFNLNEPNAPFLGNLTRAIVSKSAGENFGDKPIGTGPFIFVDYRLEQEMTFKRNDHYYEGAPKLSGVIIKFVADETVRVLELESGGVDIIMNPITPDLLPRLRDNRELGVIEKVGTNYSYLGFNMKDDLTGDIAVRRAIAYAIDRESIVTHILKGLVKPAAGLLSPTNPFYYGDLPEYKYDPEKAKKLLDEAGYKDPDGDGPKPRFTLVYSTSQNESRKRIAEIFQYQLQKVGIDLDIRSFEWGTFFSHIKKGNFQIYSLTWVGIVDPDIFHYIFHTSSMPPDGANRGRYENVALDTLLDEGRVANMPRRKTLYDNAQKIVADDMVYVSLWHSVNVAVINKRVKGFTVAPDENLRSVKASILLD